MITQKTIIPIQSAIKLAFMSADLRLGEKDFNLPYIVSPPGAGKTCILQHVSKQLGYGFISYSPALERLEKFGGIPDLNWVNVHPVTGENITPELRTTWSIPQMITEINDLSESYPVVVVLLDDWHLCDEDLQSIGFELFTYYKLNGYKINANVMFVLAGNDSSAAGAETQLSAIRNRTTLFYTKPDIRYWIENYALPNRIHPSGIAFFENEAKNGRHFHSEESASSQFGSPRSWSSAFNYLRLLEQQDGEPDLEEIRSIFEGSVHQEGAEAFLNYYMIYSKINTKDIFDNGKIDIPSDIVEQFAFSSAVADEAFNRYFNWDDKKTRTIFGICIDELMKENKEIATSMVINFGRFGTDEKNGIDKSGLTILAEMVRLGYISKELIKEMTKINKSIGGV